LTNTMRNNRPPFSGGKPERELEGRKILVGVCGGIAAYKTVELVRLFIKAGARVQVVMTKAACEFVTPLTFETITARNVYVEMFPKHREISPWHTEIASWPDMAVIAPATANHMAKLAAGLADDLLSTTMLTLERPRLLCPAMNTRMWANPATQDNLTTLKRRGYRFVMPDEGQMARPGEDEGVGRLADPQAIYREVRHILSAPQDLRNTRVLITAGRTEESWDPVRMLTNRASGRMGFALAEEARERGADVMLIHGPTDVIPPAGVRIRRITTAAEMAAAVKQEFPASQIVLMAAAVADYTFARTVEHKIKKGDPNPEVHLAPTEDILKSLAERKGNRVVVGFALETENLLDNALRKLRDKHLDIVVANNPLAPGSGFAGETNQVLIIHRGGRVVELPLKSKREVARDILNSVIAIYRHPEPEPEPEIEVEIETEHDEFEGFDIPEEIAPKTASAVPEEPPQRGHKKGRRERGFKGEKKKSAPPAAKPVEPSTPPVPPPPKKETPVPPPAAETESLFPTAEGAAKKSRRGRRGGRRAARARANKAARMTDGSNSEESSVPRVPENVPPPAPVKPGVEVKTEAGTPPEKEKKAKRGRPPTGAPRKSSPRKPKAK